MQNKNNANIHNLEKNEYILLFKFNEYNLAFFLQDVFEIVVKSKIIATPGTFSMIIGSIHLNESVIPVISLAKLLKSQVSKEFLRLIVLKHSLGKISITIDHIIDIVKINNIHQGKVSDNKLSHLIYSYYHHENCLYNILSIDKIINYIQQNKNI